MLGTIRISCGGECPKCGNNGERKIIKIRANDGTIRQVNAYRCLCGCHYITRHQIEQIKGTQEAVEKAKYNAELKRIQELYKAKKKKKKKRVDTHPICVQNVERQKECMAPPCVGNA